MWRNIYFFTFVKSPVLKKNIEFTYKLYTLSTVNYLNPLGLFVIRCITMVDAYCVKCKAKVPIKGAKKIPMKNGRPATQGKCPKCGTKVFRIGG